MKKVLVIGAGAWGTAIANLLAINSAKVLLSANDKKITDEINKKHSNLKFLPKIKLNKNLVAISDFSEEISEIDQVFIVVPSSAAAEVFKQIAQLKIKKNCIFTICSKGIDKSSSLLLSDLFEKVVKSKNYTVLSGPNFALEVANELPTITTIAAEDKKTAKKVIDVLNNKNFLAKYSPYPRSAEICGVVKNIMAIGCGIVDQLNLGVNLKSALVLKGIDEIRLLCKKMKTSEDVISPAGFGDIFLTCSSNKSRNNSLGSMLAKGKSFVEIKKETGKTYEGAVSAQEISKIAKKLKLQLDLCQTISDIISQSFSSTEIKNKIIKAVLK